jgi:probable F420-dependent oxidoreductase
MHYRPFRFGVATGSARSHVEWIMRARRAEELGYETLVVADHLTTGLAPLSALAVAAEATTRLRIGSLVFCNDFRHPALLAREAATLDLLSDGRFEFGLGAGYLPDDYTQLGLAFDAPGIRISRLEEAIQLIVRFWTEEAVTFAGTFYTLKEMQGKPKPLQRPYPPLYIGGTAKRILSLAARHADIVGIGFAAWGEQASSVAPETIAQKVAWVREAAGQRFEQLELSFTVFHLVITESARTGVGERSVSPSPKEAPSGLSAFHVLSGSTEQIVELLLARREDYGFSYIQVPDAQMEAFAPVVARLAGR